MIFEKYERPNSISECIQILSENGKNAKILAGGTDLILRLRQRDVKTKSLIDIMRIPEIKVIQDDETGLFIGSTLRLDFIENCTNLTDEYSVLKSCARSISSVQVKSVGTIGGNVCNASPSADLIPGLLVLESDALIEGPQGNYTVPLEKFFLSPRQTILKPNELLLGFKIPKKVPRTKTIYHKYSIRGNIDVAIIGVGVKISIDSRGRISNAVLAIASAGPTPLRMKEEEACLLGEYPNMKLFEEVARLCSINCSPISDQRASEQYRREMVRVWTKKALVEAT